MQPSPWVEKVIRRNDQSFNLRINLRNGNIERQMQSRTAIELAQAKIIFSPFALAKAGDLDLIPVHDSTYE